MKKTTNIHPRMVMIPPKTVQTIIKYTLMHQSKDMTLKPKQQLHKRSKHNVNKNREWEGGLVLEKGLVCVLKCPKERMQ